jgi:hypothetical protein
MPFFNMFGPEDEELSELAESVAMSHLLLNSLASYTAFQRKELVDMEKDEATSDPDYAHTKRFLRTYGCIENLFIARIGRDLHAFSERHKELSGGDDGSATYFAEETKDAT